VTAPLFFVESLHAGPVALSAQDSRHAMRSLRLRQGEEVTLADGEGVLALGRLRGERDGLAVFEVDSVSRVARPVPAVRVALAAPKGDRLSWAVQKLGELGADDVQLIDSERSVRVQPALPRLRAVAREAAMQSRRPFVMGVESGGSFTDALDPSGSTVVVLWEGAEARLGSMLSADADAVRVLIGPEGGLSDGEVEAARTAGARLASLGPGILRTETAAVVGAALVLAHYGRLG
jgi:16S rRNA (uracil1498-N3)-methyltransferase